MTTRLEAHGSSEPVNDLDLVPPRDWPVFYPMQIQPDFLDWFRAASAKARGTLSDEARRYQDRHRHERGLKCSASPD